MTPPEAETTPYPHVAVVGAGAWGTALAIVAAEAGRRVSLWGRDSALLQDLANGRENTRYLPGTPIRDGIAVTAQLADCALADAILLVIPAQHLRAIVRDLEPQLRPGAVLVICAKGIELRTGALLPEVVAETAPQAQAAVLSGPSFARDVASRLPTAVTVAAAMPVARRLQASLAQPWFRPYATDDVVGVALGGAAKNVYAIACGMAEGCGLGESARAAVLARSFAELLRLGKVLGARSETLMGLAGLGDLALSATSRSSRNFDLGYRVAIDGVEDAVGSGQPPLAEGTATASAILARAAMLGIELPVAGAVQAVLSRQCTVPEAVGLLLDRPLRDE